MGLEGDFVRFLGILCHAEEIVGELRQLPAWNPTISFFLRSVDKSVHRRDSARPGRGGRRRRVAVRIGIAGGDAEFGERLGRLRRGRLARRRGWRARFLMLDQIRRDRRLARRLAGEDRGEKHRQKDEGKTGEPDPNPLHPIILLQRRI
jgi:hypothetical protein